MSVASSTGLAQKSISFCCPRCGNTAALLPERKKGEDGKESKPRFAKEIEKLQMLQAQNDVKNKGQANNNGDEEKSSEEAKSSEEEVAPLVEENAEPTTAGAAVTGNNEATETADDTKSPTAPEQTTTEAATEPPATEEAEEFTDALQPEPTPPVVDWSFCTDRFVHNCIAIMSLLLYLLWRKGSALYSEIQEINKQLQEPIV